MNHMGAGFGMLVVETIAKIRRAYFVQKKPIKAICRELGLWIVRRHVEALGGAVTAVNRPGGGTTIAATFPIQRKGARRPSPKS